MSAGGFAVDAEQQRVEVGDGHNRDDRHPVLRRAEPAPELRGLCFLRGRGRAHVPDAKGPRSAAGKHVLRGHGVYEAVALFGEEVVAGEGVAVGVCVLAGVDAAAGTARENGRVVAELVDRVDLHVASDCLCDDVEEVVDGEDRVGGTGCADAADRGGGRELELELEEDVGAGVEGVVGVEGGHVGAHVRVWP